MASSRKSNLADIVAAHLVPLLPARSSILVGLSGGMDSVVLLHLLRLLAPGRQWQISALHVHHGISPNADAWTAFCVELCKHHGIPLRVERVDIAPLRDAHGIEAAARKLRHAAFAGQSCDFVALAHHADDQAETLLLQLLRGSGIKGAAAMPFLKHASPHVPAIVRPLLDIRRDRLLEYAREHALQWVEDESNEDDSFPRNFLRHRLLPVMERRFPAYRETLARSARHFAEARDLLDELAREDAASALHGDALELVALRTLGPARAKNLLRHFLHVQGAPMPQAVQLDDVMRQLYEAHEGAEVRIRYADWEIRRYQGRAYALQALGEFDRGLVLSWCGEAELAWPALVKRLHFRPVTGQGISLEKLGRAPVTLRLRRGGETLRPHPHAATRSLKNLLQEHRVPPWVRERLPLLYSGDELAAVGGVAIGADFQARPDEEGLLWSLR